MFLGFIHSTDTDIYMLETMLITGNMATKTRHIQDADMCSAVHN